jgi:uncharacterized protein YndB with AHSA1/START domain
MSVKKEPSGRRSVEVSVEVPGTPEEVWQAIATGPGISSWFVPTAFEGEGGVPTAVKSNFGPGMEAVATVTSWDPPRQFTAESRDPGSDAPPLATEWIIEARSGGTCIVRVVHSLFASTDDWDNQLTSAEGGWPDFFRILRLYLTHFRGQVGPAFQVGGTTTGTPSEAWLKLTDGLGLRGMAVGQKMTASGPLALAGVAEYVGEPPYPEQLLMRLDQPGPGIAHLFAFDMGGVVYVSGRLYLYGDRAAAVAARDEPLWQAWMAERFPATPEGEGKP